MSARRGDEKFHKQNIASYIREYHLLRRHPIIRESLHITIRRLLSSTQQLFFVRSNAESRTSPYFYRGGGRVRAEIFKNLSPQMIRISQENESSCNKSRTLRSFHLKVCLSCCRPAGMSRSRYVNYDEQVCYSKKQKDISLYMPACHRVQMHACFRRYLHLSVDGSFVIEGSMTTGCKPRWFLLQP